jgi:hypothetical protein
MAIKVTKHSLFRYVTISVLAFSLTWAFPCVKVAVAAAANTLEPSQEIETGEATDLPPSKVAIARVQSMAQKTVQDEAIQSRASGLTPPPPVIPKGAGRIKKDRNIAGSSSQDKNEMRQGHSSSAIQEDDSLSAGTGSKGTPSKGKSSANKEDSF